MNSPIEILTKELISMGFPEEMAKRMAVETCKTSMERSKSMENNLPAFFIDENNNIVLIDTSLGLKMNKKDAAVEKVLSDIGFKEEPDLTPDQEELLKRALDPEEQFLHDVEKLFNNPPEK